MEIFEGCVAVALGSAIQGSIGFGMGAVAAPLLMLIEKRLIPGPLLFCALTLSVLLTTRERRSIDLSGLPWALAGRLPGVLLGALALIWLSSRAMGLTFGFLVLVAVGMSVSGLRFAPGAWTLLGAGAVSGFMGTVASIGGPPMALVYQDSPGARVRGTLGGYFIVGVSMSLVALAGVGRFGASELRDGLLLWPGVGVGFALSRPLAPWLDRGYSRGAILLASAASAILVILRELY